MLGQGYLLGILATCLILFLWGTVILSFHFWLTASCIFALGIGGLIAIKFQAPAAPHAQDAAEKPGLVRSLAILILLSLIVLRYTTLLQEVSLRPLYAWDAWMNWVPKSLVWFNHQEFTSFVSPDQWLLSQPESGVYTLGASGAWRYPNLIPLIQLWSMLGAGVSEHNLIFAPWLLVVLALGLSLYGYLRLAGASVLMSTTACYLLLNLPYVNVHTALSGYADIWVMAAFGSAVFALQEWEQRRDSSQAAIALLMAALCTQMKVPGIIFASIVAFAFLLILLKAFTRPRVYFLFAALAVMLLVISYGLAIDIPTIGYLSLSFDGVTVPYIGTFQFSYHPVHEAFTNTLFLMINWNMLWYLLIVSIICGCFKLEIMKKSLASLLCLSLALLFILFVYYFTERYTFALDYTQINRALIYLSPLIVLHVFRSIHYETMARTNCSTRGQV